MLSILLAVNITMTIINIIAEFCTSYLSFKLFISFYCSFNSLYGSFSVQTEKSAKRNIQQENKSVSVANINLK